jgi:hypothetical protein
MILIESKRLSIQSHQKGKKTASEQKDTVAMPRSSSPDVFLWRLEPLGQAMGP